MKRYLTSYSKGTLTIRDRKTGKSKRVSFCDKEIAEVVEESIKQTNYHLNTRKNSKVEIKSITDLSTWIDTNKKQHYTNWGDIPPSEIEWKTSWYDPDEKVKSRVNKSIQELNKILGL